MLVFLIAVFVFLWNYWLRDIFSVAERINIPNFVGNSYEDIVNSSEFKKLFNFEVNYAIDPEVPEGQIIGQDPEADRSMMVVPEGIDISLTVSTGVRQTTIPDVTNKHYQEATLELQNAGFIVEIASTVASDTVTEDYVISTDPAPGEQLAAGSTVFLTVSAGPSIKVVTMPNLVGSTEKDAISRIESSNLSYGDTTYIHSDYDEGTVIRQSIEAYSDVEEHTRIFIWVSLGPETTPDARAHVQPDASCRERRSRLFLLELMQGVIVKALSGFYYVKTDSETVECRARGRFPAGRFLAPGGRQGGDIAGLKRQRARG